MADLNFSCPHCNQTIACDEAWNGQEIQCPICQGHLVVPAPVPAGRHNNPLVPKPPPGGPKLGLGQTPGPAQTGNRNIPIRDLTGPPPKKKSPLPGILTGVAIVAILGAGGWFGYGWYKNREAKKAEATASAAQAAQDASGSNAPSGDNQARRRRGGAPPAADSADLAAQAAAGTNAPVIPPVWTIDVAQSKIPEGRVNGIISGTNFVAEAARVDPVGTAQVLRLLQGQPVSPDREILVYLHLKPGEKIGGQSLTISNDMKGSAVPQVAKRWKINPRYAPSLKSYYTGYAMKLELGKPAEDGSVAGKIYLALPDTEQTVVAGLFKASVAQPDPNAQPVQYQQTPTPTVNPGMSDAMQKRYGIRR